MAGGFDPDIFADWLEERAPFAAYFPPSVAWRLGLEGQRAANAPLGTSTSAGDARASSAITKAMRSVLARLSFPQKLDPPRPLSFDEREQAHPDAKGPPSSPATLWVAGDGLTYRASELDPHMTRRWFPLGDARPLFLGRAVYPSRALQDCERSAPREGEVAIDIDPKEALLCAIHYEPMRDPVIASDGHVYERVVLERIYNEDSRHLSPYTQEVLDPTAFRHRLVAARTRVHFPQVDVVPETSSPLVDLRRAAAKWPSPHRPRANERRLSSRAWASALGGVIGLGAVIFRHPDPTNETSMDAPLFTTGGIVEALAGAGLGAVLGAVGQRAVSYTLALAQLRWRARAELSERGSPPGSA